MKKAELEKQCLHLAAFKFFYVFFDLSFVPLSHLLYVEQIR